jgi:CBS domain-containing protein
MSKPSVVIDKSESMQQAVNLMKENHFKLLPVTHT